MGEEEVRVTSRMTRRSQRRKAERTVDYKEPTTSDIEESKVFHNEIFNILAFFLMQRC